MLVRVYRNLHRKCYSVVDCSTGRVCMHSDNVFLTGVKFVVRSGGRKKVLETKRKNVHAFCVGELAISPDRSDHWMKATYNPYKGPDFVGASGQPLRNASAAILTPDGLFVSCN